MIISRSPLRITLGGGGTDLPSYYREFGGLLVSAAIDKYVYVNIMRPFSEGIYLKYSQLERAEKISEVKHPIVREALAIAGLKTPQIEITTLADIPSGTGLGSSGSFTTALLKALYTHLRRPLGQEELAELACHIEIDRLGEPIGKQDQYIAALGGVTCLTFHENEKVTASPLGISINTLFDLEDNLLLFFTGFSRNAGGILKDQEIRSQQHETNLGALRVSLTDAVGDLCVTRSLDSFGFDKINFIKIDVQGSEFKTPIGGEGLIKKSKPFIFIEMEEQHLKALGSSTKELMEKLFSMRYGIYRIETDYPCDHICVPLEKAKYFEEVALKNYSFPVSPLIYGQRVNVHFRHQTDQNYLKVEIIL